MTEYENTDVTGRDCKEADTSHRRPANVIPTKGGRLKSQVPECANDFRRPAHCRGR